MDKRNLRIGLVVVDDHPLVREGLRARLSVVPYFDVIGEAANGLEALGLVAQKTPDVILIDVEMRDMNGLELAAHIRQRHPSVKVLMLSMHDKREYVLGAIRMGALGYVLKESPTEEVMAAIEAVWQGGTYFSAQLASTVILDSFAGPQLTDREHEILLLLAHGNSNKAVASKLGVSVRTVETHRLTLRRKLGVDSACELLKIAVSNGWTKL